MKQKVTKGGTGGGGAIEIPDDDNHLIACAAVVGLGRHTESYKGMDKDTAKVALVYEFLNARKTDGSPFYMAEEYTLSLAESANLRRIVQVFCGTLTEGQDFDYGWLLGRVAKVTIVHQDNGETGDALRKYARITDITLPDKKDRQAKPVKTVAVPFQWFAEDEVGPYQPHDWVPWVYHFAAKKRMPLEDIIALAAGAEGGDDAGTPAARRPQQPSPHAPNGEAQTPRPAAGPAPTGTVAERLMATDAAIARDGLAEAGATEEAARAELKLPALAAAWGEAEAARLAAWVPKWRARVRAAYEKAKGPAVEDYAF